MAVDRVESLRAYRDTLQRRFDQATHAALERVPGGEWDGMDVLRRKELEDIIHRIAEADPEPVANVAELRTPGRVFVDAVCPICGIAARVLVLIHAELVVDDDGRTIKAKASAKASAHTCGQQPLEAVEVDESSQMSLGDIVGETEPTLIARYDMPRPDDATLDRPADEKCGAETILVSMTGLAEDDTLVCERLLDHDSPENITVLGEDARDHWSEGGYGWHFEERPVARGVAEAVDETEAEEEDE